MPRTTPQIAHRTRENQNKMDTQETIYGGIDIDAATYCERMLIGPNNLSWCLDCDPATLKRWSDDGTMPPSFKVGRSIRWDVAVIKAWIAGGCEPINQTETGKDESQ
jgi:hypothetical protein